jgi:hypothetical protein
VTALVLWRRGEAPKHKEIRNPKSETNPKHEGENPKGFAGWSGKWCVAGPLFGALDFGFV